MWHTTKSRLGGSMDCQKCLRCLTDIHWRSEKHKKPGENFGSLKVLLSCWCQSLLTPHQHPPTAAHSDTALLEGEVEPTLRWQCPAHGPPGAQLLHLLLCFLGAPCPPIITTAGAGPGTLCPPALAMAKPGQGGEVILKGSCMG